jgi:hypothetical protein
MPLPWESCAKSPAGLTARCGVEEGELTMKFAAYTEETSWAIGETEAEARTEGEATIRETEGRADQLPLMKVAPIDDDLVEALNEAEAKGTDVLFDLIDGELCEVETVES